MLLKNILKELCMGKHNIYLYVETCCTATSQFHALYSKNDCLNHSCDTLHPVTKSNEKSTTALY